MNALLARPADAVLRFLAKKEMIEMSLVSKRWRWQVFSCSKSRLYTRAPVHSISRLSNSFIIHDEGEWEQIRSLGMNTRRLKVHRSFQHQDPPHHCQNVHTIDLSQCTSLTKVDRLGECVNLHTVVSFRVYPCLTQVDRLGDCRNLHTLSLRECTGLTQVDRLGDCLDLHTLYLGRCAGLTQVDRLADCQNLHTLHLGTGVRV